MIRNPTENKRVSHRYFPLYRKKGENDYIISLIIVIIERDGV